MSADQNPETTVTVQQNSATSTFKYCLNCETKLKGPFCHQCGQMDKPGLRNFWELIVDFLENTFNYDSRVYRTLKTLFFYPGKLTNEYLLGRREHYVPPLRMYLIISLIFFFVAQSSIDDTSLNIENKVSSNNTTPSLNISTEKSSNLITIEKNESENNKDNRDDKIDLNFSWLNDESNEELSTRFNQAIEKFKWQLNNDRSGLVSMFISMVSKVMFFLLPVFALQLKFFYLFTKRLYMEHLIQTLHTHCFIFTYFIISNIPSWLVDIYTSNFTLGSAFISSLMNIIEILLLLYFFYYLYKTLRNVYQQSRMMTLTKFALTSSLYFLLLLVMIPVGIFFHIT